MLDVTRALGGFIGRLRPRLRGPRAERHEPGLAQQRLAEAGRLLASSLDLRQVLDRFVAITLELMHADLVGIWLISDEEHLLTLGAQAGVLRAGVELPVRPERGKGLAGLVLATGRSLPIDDVDREPRVRNRAWFAAEGIRSFLGVPLLVEGSSVGVMACMTRTRHAWSAADVNHGEALATAAAVAIRNARLHGDTQQHLARMRALTALNHVVTSSRELQQVLDSVSDISLDLLGADAALVWAVDTAAGRLRLAASRSRHGEAAPPSPPEAPLDHPLWSAVLATRTARYSLDLMAEPLEVDPSWARASGFVSQIAVPLVADERALGVLAILTRTRRQFSAEEHELVTLFAAKAATALENARLYAETRQRLLQTETLLAVGRAVNSTLDFTEAMRRVARETGRALGADMVGAYLADPDREVLRPVAGYHVPPDLLEQFMHAPIRLRTNEYIEDGWRTQQPAWCHDAQADPRTDPELSAWIPFRSVIFFPLTVKDEPIGALFLIWWTTRPTPTPLELSLLEGIARQMALAIGNTQLFEGRVRDAQRLQALNEVARSLTAILDPQEVFGTIAKFAAELLDARMVRLWLYDPPAGELVIVASSGEDAVEGASVTTHSRIKPGSGLLGGIFETGRPEFIVDIGTDPRWLNRGLSERLDLRGFAGVPLLLKEDVIGVLSIMTRRRGDFTADERSLLEALASQAALAINNARSFEKIERSLRETQALLGVADSFSHTRDVGEIMRRVCREATRVLGADSAVFYTVGAGQEEILPAAGYHIPKSILAQARPLRTDEVPPEILEARRDRHILFIPDVAANPRFSVPVVKDLQVRSMLISPVCSKEDLFGDLVLYWWDTVAEVSDGDLALVAAVSAQAALVLENSRLLVETQSQATALREKNAELDAFVYTVSHDLKAPLVTIQGMSGLVLEEHAAGLNDEGRHFLERIQANTRQMERLILDLLALSRIGREVRPPEEVHMTELVDEILGELHGLLHARGTKVIVGDLPPVRAARVRMQQVVSNLLTNAVKYMGDTPSPTIEIGAVDRGPELEFWVRDTGIGIDPAYHEKIFEIFQRLKEVEAEGTGVGLPIVKKIVEAAGGRIWVESARGHGSTFRFTWPTDPRR